MKIWKLHQSELKLETLKHFLLVTVTTVVDELRKVEKETDS